LVEEDAPAGGEDLRLQGQEGAARVHQVGAREPVLEGDLLRAELLLHGERVERPALHRHVVADHHRLVAGDRADTGHQAAGRRRVVVAAVGRERHQLEEGRAGVEQALDPLAHEEAAALLVPPPRLRRPTLADARQARAPAAPKVSPVQKRRRARAAPTRAITKGAIIAGAIPSRTSEKAKCASLEATTTSAAASRPTPPPRAGPLTRATTGRGSSATAANTACMRRASSRFACGPASRMRRIPFRSAPAEKTLPAPVTTTTRTAGSAAHATSASPSRATSAWSSAFPTSGRSRVRVATPSSRSTRSTAQPSPSSAVVARTGSGTSSSSASSACASVFPWWSARSESVPPPPRAWWRRKLSARSPGSSKHSTGPPQRSPK